MTDKTHLINDKRNREFHETSSGKKILWELKPATISKFLAMWMNSIVKVDTKAINNLEWDTGLELLIMNREEGIADNGSLTRWKAEEPCIIIAVKLLMKVNGKMISCMGMVCCITSAQFILLLRSIGRTWTELLHAGWNMRVISRRIKEVEKEHYAFQMGSIIEDSLGEISLGGRAYLEESTGSW